MVTLRGGIPQNPNQLVISDRRSDTRDISAYRKTGEVMAQIPTSPQIVQATSWRRNTQGKIELVADKSFANTQPFLTCATVLKTLHHVRKIPFREP